MSFTRRDASSWLTTWRWPSEGAAGPLPNSDLRNGRSAAAWRATVIACARSQGPSTSEHPAILPAGGGGCASLVLSARATIIAFLAAAVGAAHDRAVAVCVTIRVRRVAVVVTVRHVALRDMAVRHV